LDSLGFSIYNNEFDQGGVLMKGASLIPIFEREALTVNVADFAAGFVGIRGVIIDDGTDINIQSMVLDGKDKLFNSSIIPGLGMRLREGSSVNFIYDRQKKEFESSCYLSGAAMLVISEEIQDKNSWMDPLVPDGLECTLPFFSFEGLTINQANESCGESFRGIQSLEFGTWGILENLSDIAGLLPDFQTFDFSVHAPKVYCEGDNIYKFSLGLTINVKPTFKPDTRAEEERLAQTQAQLDRRNGRVETARDTRPSSVWLTRVDPIIQPVTFVSGHLGEPDFRMFRANAVTHVRVSQEERLDMTGYYNRISREQQSAYRAQSRRNQAQAELDRKRAQEPKTADLTAMGSINIVFGAEDEKLKFQQVELNCMELKGEYGPVKISGGLNLLGNPIDGLVGNEDEAANSRASLWGNGFKAYVDVKVASINVKAVGQFAHKIEQNDPVDENKVTADYRYFFIDLEGTSETGIKIIPSKPVAAIYGGGGGFRYNMEIMPSEMKA